MHPNPCILALFLLTSLCLTLPPCAIPYSYIPLSALLVSFYLSLRLTLPCPQLPAPKLGQRSVALHMVGEEFGQDRCAGLCRPHIWIFPRIQACGALIAAQKRHRGKLPLREPRGFYSIWLQETHQTVFTIFVELVCVRIEWNIFRKNCRCVRASLFGWTGCNAHRIRPHGRLVGAGCSALPFSGWGHTFYGWE